MRTLVVEDDPRSRKLLEGYLRAAGYQVRSAEDGQTALRLIEEEIPDIVLLDVMMPEMTGHELCERIKQDPRTRLVQVMMVTALGSSSDRITGLDTGADDYVAKPVQRQEFLAKIRALVRARRLLIELDQTSAALAARNEELQLKKTLAQSLVHDLKSPLSSIIGNLDLLEIKCEERYQNLIERSKEGAARMLKMILDLLDVERLEEGHLEPDLQRVDAAAVARQAAGEFEITAERQGKSLIVDVEDGCWAQADPKLLRRVMDNLLSNALAHAPQAGAIRIFVGSREEGIEIAVNDSGPGIPEEFRELIFEKYSQLRDGRASGSSNRGLGLTFCRLAVEAQGGTIWVDEAPEGGARFRLIMPDAVCTANEETPPALVEC